MRANSALLTLVFFLSLWTAQPPDAFAVETRHPGAPLSARISEFSPPQQTGHSAWDRQDTLNQLNIAAIPEAPALQTVTEMFRRVRDAREWRWQEMEAFPRRLTWLYPADGCYLRASLMVEKFKEWGYPIPKQIFAFGDLSLNTPYESVAWWYHVAPVIRVGTDPYVIDPSLDFIRPLPLAAWVRQLNADPETTGFAICEPGAVSPEDGCSESDSLWDPEEREEILQNYLAEEWYQLESVVGEPPAGLLGDHPPWNNRGSEIIQEARPASGGRSP